MPVSLPTREDYFQTGAQEIFARSSARPLGSRLSPEAVFTEGTDINVIVAAASAMADEGTRHVALRFAALYLDSAEGEDLDRLVSDRFSPTVVRKQAGPSVVLLSFSRPIPPSAGAADTIDVGAKFRTSGGTEFELTQAAALPAGSSGPVTATAQAVLAGSGGNVDAGTITQFVQAPDDPQIVVTNAEPASGGADVETDESLRERARDFFRTARRGTLAAIEFGALTVDGVLAASAEEIVDAFGSPTGHVRLFISDARGQSNQLLAEAVENALLEFRAAGVVVTVVTTVPRLEAIDYVVSFRSGTDTRAAAQQLKALTVSAVNLLDPSEPLLRSMLFALARSIPGAIVPSSAVPVPAGDVQPDAGEVIKTSLDLVTVNGA